ncbi:MAG: GtrA family protein [Bacteroidota bacterium]
MKNENRNNEKVKVPFFTSFIRSQASSAVSTVFDFGSFGLLHYIFGIYYGYSTAAGNVFGAVVSFYLGRNWAFKRTDGKITHQAIRYAITSLSSAVINTSGVIFLTETYSLEPTISKAIVALIVGATFNFLMFRYFVYK